ncbi:MAG: tyrosine-type recombinase/integrase [Chloroflexota bacterium]
MEQNKNINDLTILDFAQGGNLSIAVDAFITDRKASGLTKQTIKFYQNYLTAFITYCDSLSIQNLKQINPDFIRRYLLSREGKWNPGGIHACFRSIRVFFRWLDFEDVMDPDWKNPILKVKAPKVSNAPIEPIPLEDIEALIETCKEGDKTGIRDKAIFLCLLDTGVRAQEFCDINLADVDLTTGNILIRMGKGRKPRTVFIGKKSRRALKSYLRLRQDKCPALFISLLGGRFTYVGLAQILERRAKRAGLKKEPNLHDFRRAFALTMLRNGVNIFALQRLMGHADLSMLRRYLAQTDVDIEEAHLRGSPVDKSL